MKEGRENCGWERTLGGESPPTQPGRPVVPRCSCPPFPNLSPEGAVRAGGHSHGLPAVWTARLGYPAVRMGDAHGLGRGWGS